jgi:hypothetical protein
MLFGATQLTGCASAFALGAAVGGAQAEKAPPPPSCGSVVTALALGMMIDGLLLGTLLVAAGEGLSTGDKFGIGVVAVDTAIGARLTVEACKYDRD